MDLDTDVDLSDEMPPGPMSEAAFLDWVVRQDCRYEFDGERPVPMVGNFPRHGRINVNLIVALGNRLRGSAYEVFNGDVFIRADDRLRAPDAYVVPRRDQHEGRVLVDPIAVFEIVSDGSERVDRVEKKAEYWATPSIQHYVILEQDFSQGQVFSRGSRDWERGTARAGGSIELPALGIEVPLDEAYEGLRLPAMPDG